MCEERAEEIRSLSRGLDDAENENERLKDELAEARKELLAAEEARDTAEEALEEIEAVLNRAR